MNTTNTNLVQPELSFHCETEIIIHFVQLVVYPGYIKKSKIAFSLLSGQKPAVIFYKMHLGL